MLRDIKMQNITESGENMFFFSKFKYFIGVKQECMELKYIRGDIFTESLAWNDMWCDELRGFICQNFGTKPSEQFPNNNIQGVT